MNQDTITAIATPQGMGGVAIIRISGKQALEIAEKITKKALLPRQAIFSHFYQDDEKIDSGLALYFPAPNSFTGENVVELQGHGGMVVSQMLLQAVIQAGARLAEAGEFTKRAFLNDKMDLAQAEAVADLIHARSQMAVRASNRSLQGDFSKKINELNDELLQLRIYIEASLDFPEEEIDFLSEGQIDKKINVLSQKLDALIQQTAQGKLISQGIDLALIGKPNAGKSSLLNALVGEERAIVSPHAGTTRDIIREQIIIEGIPITVLDTAGIRESTDFIEQEGIKRSHEASKKADLVVVLVDGQTLDSEALPQHDLLVFNKADLVPSEQRRQDGIWISAQTGENLALFKRKIAELAGKSQQEETPFIARERHYQALLTAQNYLKSAENQIVGHRLGELIAEDLRLAHDALGSITGKITADDLLGEIFSSFCIGK